MSPTSMAKGTALSTSLPWSGLLALSTAAFTAVLTELLPAGLLPRMAPALAVSETQVGFLVTAYAVASFAGAIPLTVLLRGLPRRPVLIGTLAGFATANAVVALSSSYGLTFAARVVAGLMGGTLWAMLVGYAARMVPAERRGRAIAIVLAGITLALSLGVPAGTAFAQMLGWRTAFGALAGLAVLLVGWVWWRVPGFPGEPPGAGLALRRVAVLPGIPAVLSVTLLLLLGHQVMYTYIAPFTAYAGFGRTGLVLLVFGVATVAGIWVTGVLVDRRLRATLLGALALCAAVMLALGLRAATPAVLLASVALWGVAFGGAPTLIQTALVDVSGPAHADVATSLQTTVYNAGIAAGSLTGGLALERLGAGALPWTALPLVAGALVTVALGRVHAFPAVRRRTWGVQGRSRRRRPYTMVVKDTELPYLRRCVALAAEALEAGDEPFGSVLVGADGEVLAEDHNRVASGDRTRPPEFQLARWSAARLTPEARAAATVYTSGEHCPMCAAAHAWVGLGRIVYVASSEQLTGWLTELGVPAPPVRPLPIQEVAPGVAVAGPVPELTEDVRALHFRFHGRTG